MSENIGKLTTPNNDGASIELDSNLIKINNPLEFNSRGKIRYDSNQKWMVLQNHYPDGDLDKGPFILLHDSDKYSKDHINDHQNGCISIAARYDENNKTVLSITKSKGFSNISINQVTDGIPAVSSIDSVVSNGTNYIQYNSGLAICWGLNILPNTTVTYPITFTSSPCVTYGYKSNGTTYRHVQGHNSTSTGFTMAIYDENNKLLTSNTSCEYLAIGRWK